LKRFSLILLASALAIAAPNSVDLNSASELQTLSHKLAGKHTPFSSQELERYGNHYTMLAYRATTGSAEVHEHEADFFFVVDGHATVVTGGTLVNPHTEKPGEIRAASIQGGERHPLGPGDVIHIAANTPHHLLIDTGKTFTYYVVKVTGQ
jgi:mannose-6-phosphate isomerase-like protein (cupin superfamily)